MVITARHEEALQATAGDIGERCHAFRCDQRRGEDVRALAQFVTTKCGVPDILVNNAGSMQFAPVADMTDEQWDMVLETNLRGPFLVTRAFLPGMLERERGDIFFISSMSGKKGDPGAGAYAASKFGLQGFAQALLYEVRKQNVRVMVLNPSGVDTGADTGPKSGAGLRLHAADIAATVVHLACLPGRTLIRDLDLWGTNP